jgi:hypothetical protein
MTPGLFHQRAEIVRAFCSVLEPNAKAKAAESFEACDFV